MVDGLRLECTLCWRRVHCINHWVQCQEEYLLSCKYSFFVPQTEPTVSCRPEAPSNPTGGGETAACGRFPRGFKSRHSSHKKLLIAFAMRSFLYEVCLSAREGRFAWEGRLPIEKGLRAWAAHFPSRFPKENPSRGSAALPFPRSGNLHQIALTIWEAMVN